jgi:hypothetical protein
MILFSEKKSVVNGIKNRLNFLTLDNCASALEITKSFTDVNSKGNLYEVIDFSP